MRGFLQKDIELLKQNRSFLGLVIVMVIFFVCIRNDAFVIIYLGMMGGFHSISTISYDEADRGMGFLMTLPATRKTYAIEKYILGYGDVYKRQVLYNVMAIFGENEISNQRNDAVLAFTSALSRSMVEMCIRDRYYTFGETYQAEDGIVTATFKKDGKTKEKVLNYGGPDGYSVTLPTVEAGGRFATFSYRGMSASAYYTVLKSNLVLNYMVSYSNDNKIYSQNFPGTMLENSKGEELSLIHI